MNKALKELLKEEAKKSLANVIGATESFGFYPTGFPYIDTCVSVKGLFPRGSLTEIMGLKSTCKTTLVLHAIGEACRKNRDKPPTVWWADFENQLADMRLYAQALGVDITASNFIHRIPSILEDGCQDIINAVRTGGIDFVGIDSNAAMRPRVEEEKGIGETKQKGVRGYLISEFCRNLTGEMSALANKGIIPPAIIIINQLYQKLNIGKASGPPGVKIYDSPGSESIKFFAACRIELKYTGAEVRLITNPYTFDKDKIRVCSFINLFVEKSKVGIPHKKVTFAVRYGEGIDPIMSFIKAAMSINIIKKIGKSPRLIYIKSDGSESSSFAGMFQLYDFLRNNHTVLLDLVLHEKLSIWKYCLASKLPMVTYARGIMEKVITAIDESETTFLESAEGEKVNDGEFGDL